METKDILLYESGDGGEMSIQSNDLALAETLYMQVYLAMFGGNVEEATIADSTDGKGTPSGALLTEVESVIKFDPDVTKPTNERGRMPIQVNLEVLPISLVPVDVTITGLSQDTPAIRSAILSNLSNYLYTVRPYIDGGELPRDKNNILYESRLQNVLTGVLSGSNFFTGFEMRVDGNIETSYTFALDNIPFLNSVTYN